MKRKTSWQKDFMISTIPLFIVGAVLAFIFLKPSPAPQLKNLPYQNASLPTDVRVTDLMQRMTNAEKIGQMALIEKNSIHDKNDIAKYGLGALLSGGGANPANNTPQGWLTMVNDFQSYSLSTRLGIPLLYGIDANHGHGNVPGATIFPHSIGLGAANDPQLVKQIAQATAEEIAATGVHWIFSPNLDVVQDIRWGRTYETFGSNPATVGSLGKAYIEGLQNKTPNTISTVATAKHFVGNGSSPWGSSLNKDYIIDQGDSTISETQLRQTHIEPFKQAMAAHVQSVMVGLNSWNGQKISDNTHLITDILKGELGFQGFVVSDWYGVYEREPNKYEALVRAINAGNDMIMLPYDYKFFSTSMQQALANGDVSQERLDDAVRRILTVKFDMGLFEHPTTDAANIATVGSAEHRTLARKAVRQSLVLLKNSRTVPLSKKTATILVAGSGADNLGQQSGGWTVEWQGVNGNIIPGTTILQGIKNTVAPTSNVIYNEAGNFPDQQQLADIGIAVVGEKPYAEGWGDQEYPALSPDDLKTITNLRQKCKKIIVVIISGRPLDITDAAKNWDAVIAAWLPGSEGQGVADVLFGDYPFTGKLPVEWKL